MTRKPSLLLAGGVALAALPLTFLLPPGPGAATPGTGVGATVLAKGTMTQPATIRTRQPSDVVLSRLTVSPGGTTGWHSHPGPLLVIVESGTLTLYDEHCQATTYRAGQALQMPVGHHHPHLVANQGSAPLVASLAFVVPAGAPRRVDAFAPDCAAAARMRAR